MSDYIHLDSQNFTFFGKGCQMTGEFILVGPTHICAKLEGDVKIADGSELVLERTASLKGTLTCHNVHIHGVFEGVLNSSGRVTIYSSAQISGEINSEHLVIHPGASVNIDAHTEIQTDN